MKKFIAVLAASAMLASATSAFAATVSDDFENGFGNWTGINNISVALDPTDEDNNAMHLAPPGSSTAAATYTFDPIGQSNKKADVSFRIMLPTIGQNQAAWHGVTLKSGSTVIAPFTVLYHSVSQWTWYLAFGFHNDPTDPNNANGIPQNQSSLPYSTVLYDNVQYNPLRWYYLRFLLNFETNTLDAYVANTPITDNMISTESGLLSVVKGITFNNNVDYIDTLAVSASWVSQNRDIYYDDFRVTDEISIPAPVVLTKYGDNDGVSAEHNDTTGTIRFSSLVTGADADSAGACVIPVSLFNDDFEAANVARVSVSEAVTAGQTFGADITGVPAANFGTQLIAKPFVVVNGVTQWATYTQQSSINDAIAAYLAAQE